MSVNHGTLVSSPFHGSSIDSRRQSLDDEEELDEEEEDDQEEDLEPDELIPEDPDLDGLVDLS